MIGQRSCRQTRGTLRVKKNNLVPQSRRKVIIVIFGNICGNVHAKMIVGWVSLARKTRTISNVKFS